MSLDKHECNDNTKPIDEDHSSMTSMIIQDTHSTGGVNLDFLETHPWQYFTTLTKLKNRVVPMMYYDSGRMRSMVKLHFRDDDCNKNTRELSEDYAKIALFMFICFINWRTPNLMEVTGNYSTENCKCLKTTK
jgi:regulatory protein YycH of two-component signal transduction system YycFG